MIRLKKISGAYWKNKKRLVIIAIPVLVVVTVLVYFCTFDRSILDNNTYSTTFYDRQGTPLRTLFSGDEKYSEKCSLSEISPHFLRAIVLVEDKNFYSHKGIVLSSLARAFWQNITSRRVVSGGSTITMQFAKLLYDHRKRHIWNKIAEVFTALRLEIHLEKSEILAGYINRLPFGNMVYGIKEASRFYFSKKPAELSLNQAIYLALIPKSPSRCNPRSNAAELEKRRLNILEIFRSRNYITRDEYLRAKNEGIHFSLSDYPFAAPHLIDMVKESYRGKTMPQRIDTTIDLHIQEEMEGIIREHLVRLRKYDVKSAAAVVIDNRSHEVIALMGSPHYFDETNAGFVNLATSFRQPGSTLKPFVYALALEEGYTPSSILPDIKFPSKGGFFPKNHDGKEHGPLRLRVALACSYNIPAFYLAMKLTPSRVISILQQAGFAYLNEDPGFYGETIALGSGEVKLFDLVTAYSAFANGGTVYTPVYIKGQPVLKRQLFNERVAFLTWHILSDPAARFAGFGYETSMNLPFPLAVKTGTSKGFRDKWAIGVNALYTVGVWLGNPKGENMKDLSGVGSAAAVLRDIFLAIQDDWTQGEIALPAGVVKRTVCPLSGEAVAENCRDAVDEVFLEENQPQGTCTWHIVENGIIKVKYPELYRQWAGRLHQDENLEVEPAAGRKISFPQQGDFFYISDAVSMNDQEMTFEVMGFEEGEEVEYILDGHTYAVVFFPGKPAWRLEKGDHTLVVKSRGQVHDRINFIVR